MKKTASTVCVFDLSDNAQEKVFHFWNKDPEDEQKWTVYARQARHGWSLNCMEGKNHAKMISNGWKEVVKDPQEGDNHCRVFFEGLIILVRAGLVQDRYRFDTAIDTAIYEVSSNLTLQQFTQILEHYGGLAKIKRLVFDMID